MLTWILATAPAQEIRPEDVAGLAFVLLAIGIMLLIGLAINIVICALLYVAQKRVPAEHRKIDPLAVWLLLIPLFNLVWNFFVYRRIPQSYCSYFNAQGVQGKGDCGETIGLWLAICYACSIIPCVNYIAGPAALVLLIIFLVKIMGLRGEIPEAAAT